ncbi:MAG TPA: zinc-binding dehydrogenase, partial [Actinomycetota bacterium]|nr:zinc-binding dehydrogenase [Actinomycetota bacterium]
VGKWFDALHRTFKAMFVGPFGKQKLLPLMSRENSADLLALNELIDAGKVAPSIDRTYSLSEASAAIRYVQDGRAGGKVAITV